jgi:hypothetical protein
MSLGYAAAVGQGDLDRGSCRGFCLWRKRLRACYIALGNAERDQARCPWARELSASHLAPPCAKQGWIHVVAGRNYLKNRSRFFACGNQPQLLLHTPPATALPCAKNLDRVVGHDFKVVSKLDFTVATLATYPGRAARRSSPDRYALSADPARRAALETSHRVAGSEAAIPDLVR